jgi:hypothetical protein
VLSLLSKVLIMVRNIVVDSSSMMVGGGILPTTKFVDIL